MKSHCFHPWIMFLVGLVLAFCDPVHLMAQSQLPEPGSQSATQNAKRANVASRAPGLRIRAAIGGPQITQTREQADEPSRLQQVYIDIINVLFLGLNQLIPLLPELFPESSGPVGIGELVITEIANDGADTFIELHNPSGLRIELDEWALCKVDGCTAATEFTGRVMESGDILVLQLDGQLNSEFADSVVSIDVVGSPADDLGLYDFTGAPARDPQDPVAMVDYLQWGDFFQSFGLEQVAVSSGLWVSNSSLGSSLTNQSFQLRFDALNRGGNADDYIEVPFQQNTLRILTPENFELVEEVLSGDVPAEAAEQ